MKDQKYYDALRDKLSAERDATVESFEKVLGAHRNLMIEEFYVTNSEGEASHNKNGDNIIDYVPSILWILDGVEVEVVFYEDEINMFFNDLRCEELEGGCRIFSQCNIENCIDIAKRFMDGKIELNGEDTQYVEG